MGEHRHDVCAAVGVPHDRSFVADTESFFGHLEDELYCNTTFLTVDALIEAIDAYVIWSNTDRGHTALQGLSPAEHRTQALTR